MTISMNTNQIADSQAINRIFYNYAIKNTQNIAPKETTPTDTKEDDIKLIQQNNLFKNIDIEDIKNSAKLIGEDITDEDIQYGLTYGRSVLADYSA